MKVILLFFCFFCRQRLRHSLTLCMPAAGDVWIVSHARPSTPRHAPTPRREWPPVPPRRATLLMSGGKNHQTDKTAPKSGTHSADFQRRIQVPRVSTFYFLPCVSSVLFICVQQHRRLVSCLSSFSFPLHVISFRRRGRQKHRGA